MSKQSAPEYTRTHLTHTHEPTYSYSETDTNATFAIFFASSLFLRRRLLKPFELRAEYAAESSEAIKR